jgi:hypothetical protein
MKQKLQFIPYSVFRAGTRLMLLLLHCYPCLRNVIQEFPSNFNTFLPQLYSDWLRIESNKRRYESLHSTDMVHYYYSYEYDKTCLELCEF